MRLSVAVAQAWKPSSAGSSAAKQLHYGLLLGLVPLSLLLHGGRRLAARLAFPLLTGASGGRGLPRSQRRPGPGPSLPGRGGGGGVTPGRQVGVMD